MRFLIVIMCFSLSFPLVAKSKSKKSGYVPPMMSSKTLPRMISRVGRRGWRAKRKKRKVRRGKRVARTRRVYKRVTRRRIGKEWGLQLTTVGKPQNSNPGALGLIYTVGMRFVYDIPFYKNFVFEPALGLMYGSQGAAQVSLNTYRIEPSANVFWVPKPRATVRWRIGVVNRFDFLISEIKAFDDSGTGLGFGYRVGPNMGIAVKAGRNTSFTLDFETTFDLLNDTRIHYGLSAGFMFAI